MSLAEMRKELKELRKKAMPVPVSRMKKETVAAELERLRGKEEVAVKEAVKEAPKKVKAKVEVVQKKAHKEQEEVLVKKTKGVRASAEVKVPTLKERGMEEPPKKKAKTEPKAEKPKSSKGSEEMRAKMAALRAMRKSKPDPEED
jgi:hypothetical protein